METGMEFFFDVDKDKTLQKSRRSTNLFFEHEIERLKHQPFYILYNVSVAEENKQLLLPAKYSVVFICRNLLNSNGHWALAIVRKRRTGTAMFSVKGVQK